MTIGFQRVALETANNHIKDAEATMKDCEEQLLRLEEKDVSEEKILRMLNIRRAGKAKADIAFAWCEAKDRKNKYTPIATEKQKVVTDMEAALKQSKILMRHSGGPAPDRTELSVARVAELRSKAGRRVGWAARDAAALGLDLEDKLLAPYLAHHAGQKRKEPSGGAGASAVPTLTVSEEHHEADAVSANTRDKVARR